MTSSSWIRRACQNASLPKSDAVPLKTIQLTRALGDCRVLDGINLDVSAGEIVGLLGSNGVGKTTLLKCLAGLLRPTAGVVLWHGVSPCRRPDLHRQVGYAGHDSFLYLELSARENLLFAARMHGLARPQQRTTQMLSRLHMQRQADLRAGALSRGTRQRLSLARALIHEPSLVILDEPFSGLDVANRQWLQDWLMALKAQGRAVIFTSHAVQQCFRLANRALELKEGRLHVLPSAEYTAMAA